MRRYLPIWSVMLLLLPVGAFAEDDPNFKWYSRDYDDDIVIRASFGGVKGYGESTYSLNGSDITNGIAVDSVAEESTFGAFVSADYALNDYFSAQGSLGYHASKTIDMRWDIAGSTSFASGRLNMIPVEAELLFYPAPYGRLKPYVSAGYNYTYITDSFSGVDFDSASGPVASLGLDWWSRGSYGINVNVSKKWMDYDIDYTSLISAQTPTVSSFVESVDYNPVTFSVGLAYRF